MKKLFRIKIQHECFEIANTQEEAMQNFWERREQCGGSLDTFIDDITSISEIEEAEELLEEDY